MAGDTTLSEALYSSVHRWGWQYVEPPVPELSPLFYEQPLAAQIAQPDIAPLQHANAIRRSKTKKRVVVLLLLAVLFGATTKGAGLILVAIIGLIWYWPMIRTSRKIARLSSQYETELHRANARHSSNLHHWEEAKKEELRRNALARDAANLWFPVVSPDQVERIDVFGGAPQGWPHLVTHLLSYVVADGVATTFLDLTEADIAGPLMELARSKVPVTGVQIPRDVANINLFEGLSPDDVIEVLGLAMQTLRRSADSTLRMMDERILRHIVQSLGDRITLPRMLAGTGVLLGSYDPEQDILGPLELTSLTRAIDSLQANTENVRAQVLFVHDALGLLSARAEGTGEVALPILPEEGLLVIATADPASMRKEFFDRVLFHTALQLVKTHIGGLHDHLLVIAGADHLGLDSLEQMARFASRQGLRLVFLFEHLRGDTLNMLGTGHSATILMRLGNANEASAAAEYVGREHSFQMSQLSRQVGISNTSGGGTSSGFSTNVSRGSSSGSSSSQGQASHNASSSYSEAISSSLQSMSNWSTAHSVNDSTTEQRVYEFSVEPTVLQSLPSTAFVFVTGGAGGRQALVGDCNPAIALLDRVSELPLALYKYPTAELTAPAGAREVQSSLAR